VANQVWPVGVTTTYGECIVMGAFWCMLRKKQYAGRIGFGAAVFAGCFIVLFNILAITALGEYLFQRMAFPVYTILKMSSIADFLENLEVLGAMYFLCSAFVKIAVYLFSAVLCIRELTHSSRDRSVIWIVTISAYVIAMTMANNLSEHLQVWVGSMAQVIVGRNARDHTYDFTRQDVEKVESFIMTFHFPWESEIVLKHPWALPAAMVGAAIVLSLLSWFRAIKGKNQSKR
jgi:hypothetical protein